MKPDHFREVTTCEMCVYSNWRGHAYTCIKHKFEIQDEEATEYICNSFQLWIYKDIIKYFAICNDCNQKELLEEVEFLDNDVTLCTDCYKDRKNV